MAGVSAQHRLQPSWDPGLTIAHLSLPHLLSRGLSAAVLDVDRTLLPVSYTHLTLPTRS